MTCFGLLIVAVSAGLISYCLHLHMYSLSALVNSSSKRLHTIGAVKHAFIFRMPPTRAASSSSSPEPAAKRRKRSSPSASPLQDIADAGDRFGDEYGAKWAEWPAPRSQMTAASEFIRDM